MAFKTKNQFDDGTIRMKFETAGETLEGHIISTDEVETANGPCPKYVVLTANGARMSFLASTGLARDLADIELGTLVRITYKGKVQTKSKRTANSFSVEFDSDSKIDPTVVNQNAASIVSAQMKAGGGATLKVS